ncbi:MAG: MFS transporter [Proteobacteria bacterium]|nr:MFS transporter [Pseudomonadota bacterium]
MIAALHVYRMLLRLDHVPQLFWAACLSRLAARMFALAIVLYALARFQSPAIAGWVSFAALAPGLAISPLAGAILDRVGAARAIVVDMAVNGVLLLALALGGWANLISMPALLAIVALQSLTSPLSAAGIRVLIPQLVPAAELDRANALDTASFALMDVAGPALAGLLMAFAGPHITMLTIALLSLAASLSLIPLMRHGSTDRSTPAPSLLRQAAVGLAYVMKNPSLRGLAVSYSLYQVSWGVLAVAVPVVMIDLLGAGSASESAVGLLWAAAGVAGGLGALYAGHARTDGRERRFLIGGILATALAIAAVALMPNMAGLAIGLVLVGLFAGPVDIAVLSLRQRRTDPGQLGRVMAVSMSLNISGLPVGSALGGMLIGTSPMLALVAAAIASALAALAAWQMIPAYQAGVAALSCRDNVKPS